MNLCISFPAAGGIEARKAAYAAAPALTKHYLRFCRRLRERGINWDIPIYQSDERACFKAGGRWVQLDDFGDVRQLLQPVSFNGARVSDRMAMTGHLRRMHAIYMMFARHARRRGDYKNARGNLDIAKYDRQQMNEKGIPNVL